MKTSWKYMRVPVVLIACVFFEWAPSASAATAAAGAVYAKTNLAGANSIVVYSRFSDGTLTALQTIATGGGGSGIQLNGNDALGSEGSIVLDQNHQMLYAVNTETAAAAAPGTLTADCNTGSISSFSVASDGRLTFIQKISSGGLFPDSLAIHGSLLYVLNAGGGAASGCGASVGSNPNITGFTIGGSVMSPLAGSMQSIDPGAAPPGSFLNCDGSGGLPPCGLNPPMFARSPAQVGFTPSGSQIVVTDKGPNKIYVFPVNNDGTPGTPAVYTATIPVRAIQIPHQPTYFGFDFDAAGHLIVAEPFGQARVIPTAPASSVSSFTIGANGSLTAISASVPNMQGTSCWVKVVGQYAYTSNNESDNISSYTIDGSGHLTLKSSAAASLNGAPNDIEVVQDAASGNNYLYVLDGGQGTVDVFRIGSDGTLSFVQSATGMPANLGAQGLTAY
jgi:6-phosphogluconolactonase